MTVCVEKSYPSVPFLAASGHSYRGEKNPPAQVRKPRHVCVGDSRAAGGPEGVRLRGTAVRVLDKQDIEVTAVVNGLLKLFGGKRAAEVICW